MPRKKDIMSPTAKRTEGAIYNFEMRDAHNKAKALAKELDKKNKDLHLPIHVLSYNQYGQLIVKEVYPVHH